MFRQSFKLIQIQSHTANHFSKKYITSWIPKEVKVSANKAIENLPTYEEFGETIDDAKMKVYDKSFENAMRFVKIGEDKAKTEGLSDVEITISVALGPVALTIVKKIP